MTISVAEFLTILVCTGAMFLILAVAAWILINKSRYQQSRERNARLEELDQQYAAGEIDDDEYQRRRSEIQNDKSR